MSTWITILDGADPREWATELINLERWDGVAVRPVRGDLAPDPQRRWNVVIYKYVGADVVMRTIVSSDRDQCDRYAHRIRCALGAVEPDDWNRNAPQRWCADGVRRSISPTGHFADDDGNNE